MSAVRELCYLYGINPQKLSRIENSYLEANIFTFICDELKEIHRAIYKEYFHLMKFSLDMENKMLENNFMRNIINDILSTQEYDLSGIAYYSNTPEEVIDEIALGLNTSPSLMLSRKIIELHRATRPEIYNYIINKISTENKLAN